MTEHDAPAFMELWASAQEYYGKRPSPGTANLAFEVLRRFDFGDIARAVSLHLADPDRGQFAPKPADVVRAIEGSGEAQSLNAWHKVHTAMRTVGAYQSVAFDDWRIHAAIARMGGWQSLCHAEVGYDGEKLPFLQREFERHYRAAREGDQFPRKLVGLAEQHNEQHGFLDHIGEPALIGDRAKAVRLLDAPTSDSSAPALVDARIVA